MPSRKSTKPRVLIVDDDDDVRRLLRFILWREGYEAVEAGTGQQALALAVDASPALILLDVMMPDADGLDICRTLKGDPRTCGVPVIVVTAYFSAARRAEARLSGGADLIAKPFSPYMLIERVRAVMDQYASQRDAASV